MIDPVIFLAVISISTLIGIMIINSIDVNIKSESFDQIIYLFLMSGLVFTGIVIVFSGIITLKNIENRNLKLLLDSYIYLPFFMMAIGQFATRLSRWGASKITMKNDFRLEEIDELIIYSVSILGVAIVAQIWKFDMIDVFALIAIWFGRFIWFDTKFSTLVDFMKIFVNKFQSSDRVARVALTIVLTFIVSGIAINMAETSKVVRSAALGIYLSLFTTGGIKLFLELRKIKKSKLSNISGNSGPFYSDANKQRLEDSLSSLKSKNENSIK